MDPTKAQETAQEVASALSLAAESIEVGYPDRPELLQVGDEAKDLSQALEHLRLAPIDQAYWVGFCGFMEWAANLDFRLSRYLAKGVGPRPGSAIH